MKLIKSLYSFFNHLPNIIFIDTSLEWGSKDDSLEDVLLDFKMWRKKGIVVFTLKEQINRNLPELTSFVNRLGLIPVVSGVGDSIDLDIAFKLGFSGVKEVNVIIGGMTPQVHQQIVGGNLEKATEAVLFLLDARDSLRTGFKISVEFPCSFDSYLELDAVEGWARQVGVDYFKVVQPFFADSQFHKIPISLKKKLERLEKSRDPFHQTLRDTAKAVKASWEAGDAREGAKKFHTCRLEKYRITIGANGGFGVCPFKGPLSSLEKGKLSTQWKDLDFSVITKCDRSCSHPELRTWSIYDN